MEKDKEKLKYLVESGRYNEDVFNAIDEQLKIRTHAYAVVDYIEGAPSHPIIDIFVRCRKCGELFIIKKVDHQDYKDWCSGIKIQEALSGLSNSERELLVSQTCGECWNKMFNDQFSSDYFVGDVIVDCFEAIERGDVSRNQAREILLYADNIKVSFKEALKRMGYSKGDLPSVTPLEALKIALRKNEDLCKHVLDKDILERLAPAVYVECDWKPDPKLLRSMLTKALGLND